MPNTNETTETIPTAADPSIAETAATPTLEDAMLTGMDEGIAAVTPEPVPDAQKPDPADADAAAPAKPDAAQDAPKPDAAPEPDKDTEAEIAGLALKDKAADRFRGMAAEIRELAPIKAQLDAAGVKSISDLPQIIARAKDADDMIGMVTDTGASAEQFGQTLDYLKLLTAAGKGDVQAAEKAYAVVSGELAALAQLLGKTVPGVHDALAAHADLVAEVEAGDLTRARAEEIAATRQQAVVQKTAHEVQHNAVATQQAQESGRQALNALGQQIAAADPDYERKLPQLIAARDLIRESYPPAEWAPRLAKFYQALPALPAVAPSKPTPGPVRATGPRAVMAPTAFASVADALDYGIANSQ